MLTRAKLVAVLGSVATVICFGAFPAMASAEFENLPVDSNYVNQKVERIPVEGTVEGSSFAAEAERVDENESILTLENAKFEVLNGDIVAVTENGDFIENVSAGIESVPGVEAELLSENQLHTTIKPEEYPELQLKCAVSALSGGTAAMVATGLGLAALGITTGGAAFATLALGAAAGYGAGAVEGGCFG